MTERPATQHLSRTTWTPESQVDITPDLQALAGEGLAPFPTATEFLRSFSGLRIPYDHGGPDEIWFSAKDACAGIASAWVDDYSARAGTRLLPVGEAARGHLTLLIGEDGRWFAGYDDEFGLIGETLLDALDNLILNHDFIRRL